MGRREDSSDRMENNYSRLLLHDSPNRLKQPSNNGQTNSLGGKPQPDEHLDALITERVGCGDGREWNRGTG